MNMPKGWAPLGTWLGRRYRMPDGSWLTIQSREDMDALIDAYDLGNIPAGERKEPEPVDPETKRRMSEALAYVRDYRGTWGLILDIRADRRFGTKYMRLSERQVEVILAGKARDAEREVEREIAQAEAYERSRTQTQVRATEGWYSVEGTVYKVQKAVHGSGHLYAKRLIVNDGTGVWEYAPGMVNRLTEAQRLTVEEAERFGRLYGICGVCGAQLTDETSISRGIGPVCAGRLS